jgi:hypothetical protein
VIGFQHDWIAMLEISDTDATSILSFFDELPDPRSTVNRLHLLGDVIVIAICGVLANADGPAGIEKWAVPNGRWLKEHLQLANDIPARDTIRRVLTALDPLEFQRCFAQWIDSLTFLTDEQKAEQKKHIAIDGKALRRSHDKKNGLACCLSSARGHPIEALPWGKWRPKKNRTRSPRSLNYWTKSI